MNAPKVSILVPIYNVEPYLKRCVDSVLNQSFVDWEMILVDDGSPDRCPAICDVYSARDSRIKVIHKANGGLISARKAGFEAATSEWIMFLDSDDWLTHDALELLYSHICDDVDLIRGGTIFNDSNGNILPEDHYTFEDGEINDNRIFMQRMFSQEIAPYLWGALYRRSLFTSRIFDVGINACVSFGEDWLTNLLAGVNVRKACYFTHKVYNYFRNSNSIVHSFVISPFYQKRIYVVLEKEGIIGRYNLEKTSKKQYSEFLVNCLFIPELTIGYKSYADIRNTVDVTSLERKKRLFYNHKYLYWWYAKFYKLAFKYFRLKGKTRRILM